MSVAAKTGKILATTYFAILAMLFVTVMFFVVLAHAIF